MAQQTRALEVLVPRSVPGRVWAQNLFENEAKTQRQRDNECVFVVVQSEGAYIGRKKKGGEEPSASTDTNNGGGKKTARNV